MTICKHCKKALNHSQFRNERKLKSCPKCSKADGKEHIYYPFPSTFGTTPLRATPSIPDGAQSYCVSCRGNGTGPYAGYLRCSQI